MKEIECDGAFGKGMSLGKEIYYEEKGKEFLLCETLKVHWHCDCGEPIFTPGNCRDCNQKKAGLKLHRAPSIKERRVRTGLISTIEVPRDGLTQDLS